MNFRQLSIPDILLIEPKVFTDPRGYFMETYKVSVFAEHGINHQFVQDNIPYLLDKQLPIHYL